MSRKMLVLLFSSLIPLFIASCGWSAKLTSISAGYQHTIALKDDGTILAWGSNYYGQLGDGTTTNQKFPVQVQGLSGVIAVAAGNYHSIALKSDGTVWAWGDNSFGQLGNGTTSQTPTLLPVQVSGLDDVRSIAAGEYCSFAIKNDGTLWVWGNGPIGDGINKQVESPVQINITNVTAIAVGISHALALKDDGTVWSWGDNAYGQLGDGTTTSHFTPVQIPTLSGVNKIAAAGYHSVALVDGCIWKWGQNVGSCYYTRFPRQFSRLSDIIDIDAGKLHVLALSSNGSIWSWGENDHGQLGDGTTTISYTPSQIPGISYVTAISAGGEYSTVVRSDGSVWAWGNNDSGQLGDGTTTNRLVPTRVLLSAKAVKIAAGGVHSALLTENGAVWAWGGMFTEFFTVPTYKAAIPGATSMMAGNTSVSLLDNNGAYWGWGYPVPFYSSYISDPLQVSQLTDVKSTDSGYDFGIAAKADGTVWTWGDNSDGQLGDLASEYRIEPAQVPNLAGFVSVSAGYYGTSVALKRDGTVWMWGLGWIGDGTIVTRHYSPAQTSISGVVAISGGLHHVLALKNDGTVWAWGVNAAGQLGDTTKINRYLPVQVMRLADDSSGYVPLDGVIAIAAGGAHSVALRNDGTVWTWGAARRLGDGTTTTRPYAGIVPGLTGVTAITAGSSHTIALKNDGTVWAWGQNDYSQIGDGTTDLYRLTPVCVYNPDASYMLPRGTIVIDGGSTCTSSPNVTLTLSAANDEIPIIQMCFSSNGLSFGDWEDYALTRSYTLTDGDGINEVYVKFKDALGNESMPVEDTIILDTTAPVISSASITPKLAAAGDSLQVQANVEDSWSGLSVTADGVALQPSGGNLWTGTITAASGLGAHTVNLAATDEACHPTANAAATYKTAKIVGMPTRLLYDPIISNACDNFLFRLYGRVAITGDSTFTLTYGLEPSINVIAPGYINLVDNDLISVRGILDPTTTPPTLTSSGSFITKYNADGSEATE